MNKEVTFNAGGSTALLPLLTVLFVALKLTGYIAWPWVWVLSPVWIPFALALVVGLVVLVAVGVGRRG